MTKRQENLYCTLKRNIKYPKGIKAYSHKQKHLLKQELEGMVTFSPEWCEQCDWFAEKFDIQNMEREKLKGEVKGNGNRNNINERNGKISKEPRPLPKMWRQ